MKKIMLVLVLLLVSPLFAGEKKTYTIGSPIDDFSLVDSATSYCGGNIESILPYGEGYILKIRDSSYVSSPRYTDITGGILLKIANKMYVTNEYYITEKTTFYFKNNNSAVPKIGTVKSIKPNVLSIMIEEMPE